MSPTERDGPPLRLVPDGTAAAAEDTDADAALDTRLRANLGAAPPPSEAPPWPVQTSKAWWRNPGVVALAAALLLAVVVPGAWWTGRTGQLETESRAVPSPTSPGVARGEGASSGPAELSGLTELELRVRVIEGSEPKRLRRSRTYPVGTRLAFQLAATTPSTVVLAVSGPGGQQDLAVEAVGIEPSYLGGANAALSYELQEPGEHVFTAALAGHDPIACALPGCQRVAVTAQ